MNNSKRLSIKISFCGLLAALSMTVLFLTGVVPVATIALPAIAGCLLIPVVAELGVSWGFGVFAVCGVLSFLLTPDREAALFYVLFFGYYPMLLGVLGKVRNTAIRWVVKLLCFNGAAVLETILSIYVLGIPWENLSFLGKATPAVLLLLANVVFLLYDRALGGLISIYFQKLHKRIQKALKGK